MPEVDLSIDQIVDPPVRAWFRNNAAYSWVPDTLTAIDHGNKYCYRGLVTGYSECTLKEPLNALGRTGQ